MKSSVDPGLTRPHGDAGLPGVALPWIDWVRFLAAFAVFLFHLRPYLFEPYDRFAPAHKTIIVVAWFAITHFGGEAVLIFFALSGYLVGGGLIERVRAGTFRPGAYAIDRATRLLVPFLPAMAAAVALQLLNHQPVSALTVVGNLVSLQNVLVPVQPYLGVDWSLAYEVWFYVLGGAIAVCLLNVRWRAVAIALTAVAFLVFSRLESDYLFCWVLGALASQVKMRRASLIIVVAGLLLTGAGVLLSNSLFAALRLHYLHSATVGSPLPRIITTVGILVVLSNLVLIVPKSSGWRRINALGTRLAAFSYSLYLIHVPIFTLLLYVGMPTGQDMTAQAVAQYLGYVVLVPVAAYGFYWLFERHTDTIRRSLKRSFATK